jgi:23S rRNA (pseudouridine1915-N3)-methyltransferase
MLKLRILAVGKLKESWLLDGCRDYLLRLRPFAKVEVLEFADEPARDNLSEAQINNLLSKEGEKVEKAISPSTHVVLLDLAGRTMTSDQLATYLMEQGVRGCSQFDFVIGGSHGVSEGLKRRADLRLAFSSFTFPHQLMRVILLEQLYRSMKINAGQIYHK